MVLLYQLGAMLEPALGRVRFVALYAAALLSGSFGVLLISPLALTAGASGAVFGLFGAAAVGLHQRGRNVLQTSVGLLLVINLVLTFVIPGISIGGHVGGLIGGGLVGAVMLRVAPTGSGRRAYAEGLAMAAVVIVAAVVGSLHVA